VLYGYRGMHQDMDSFMTELVNSLAMFIKLDALFCALLFAVEPPCPVHDVHG
jgi:hypothetical protein